MVHRWQLTSPAMRMMCFEAQAGVAVPKQFRNPLGQLTMDAPYTHRDFVRPEGPIATPDHLPDGPKELFVKKGGAFTRLVLERCPMDVVGFTFLSSLSLTVFVGLSAQAVTYFLYVTMFLAIFQHTNIRTPQWLGYIVQRPESHSIHHARGIHHYNYSDLPLFDILFGTFRNPKDFAPEAGFYHGASAKLPQILAFKDIANNEYDPAMKLHNNVQPER